MKLISVAALALASVFVHAQYAGSQPVPSSLKKGFDSIRIEDAKKHLEFLAGPECEGRGSGQPGFQKAAEYMAARFKEAGLKPAGDDGTFFQNVPFTSYGVDPAQSYIAVVDGSGKAVGLADVSFGRLGIDADKTAEVLVVHGSGPQSRIADVDQLDGKIVFIVGESKGFQRQVNAANTVAVIRVVPKVVPTSGQIRRGTGGTGSSSMNSISMSENAAKRLLSGLGSPQALSFSSVNSDNADVFSVKGSLRIVSKAKATLINVPNVVGVLPGSDPVLKNEVVGVGAHLDHLGKNGDTVYPGADDDGSGSTALLEVIHAIHESGIKPKRSMIFMAFCGEEMGLIGSGWYSDHPFFPHDKMVAELQMDMVGRDSDGVQNGDPKRVDKKEENIDTMRLVGSKRISTDLHNAVLENNKYIGFKFKWDAEDVYTRSDHYNFAKHGIPIAFLFDGFHPDYHQPTDTVDKINWEKLTNAAKLYYLVGLDLANRANRPRKDVPQGTGD